MGEDYGPIFSSFAWALNSGFFAADECCAGLKESLSDETEEPALLTEEETFSARKKFAIFAGKK